MKRDTIVQITGKSSTGSPHGLLVEAEPTGGLRFTVTGHDGKKRHAAVILPVGEVSAALVSIIDHLTES
ncbi:hypothetical protein SEA_MORROW_89 [Mycobacterium phage Morrow]|uniref:Uncharacterized protein n=49 Tax=Backyardiganvirus TaxID=2946815 RepID=A0A1B1SE63_9CAUD|nr:hypothetical protein PEACHES_84 [Mycobacterium phage Peaches]YP_009005645.1 hypothetical protein CH07_gp87 [Mycobacterium phage BellusTerra]YP_009007279.1 hypothetical protein PBI_OBAMA12_87 [Mycobacterium phage Obama12]YP_009018874.1 hypothetical protein LHTSCC_89 [Mycobacterium phage LHTSCC]YP_009190945.1 hypothetical protein SEA_IRACEMA64_86 [Mycobacterium phage Iracema64]YP_009638741.1 hypothetical protein FGG45_gp84 [Mycobacterium phage Arturo]YP_010062562.1 hypothetical protein KIY69